MLLSNPQVMDHIKEYNGQILRIKVIDLGDWDMDTTGLLDIDTAIPYTNWIHAEITIRGDPGSAWLLQNLCGDYGAPTGNGRWNHELAKGDNIITIRRETGGIFDSIGFDQTPYNRGWLMLWYVE